MYQESPVVIFIKLHRKFSESPAMQALQILSIWFDFLLFHFRTPPPPPPPDLANPVKLRYKDGRIRVTKIILTTWTPFPMQNFLATELIYSDHLPIVGPEYSDNLTKFTKLFPAICTGSNPPTPGFKITAKPLPVTLKSERLRESEGDRLFVSWKVRWGGFITNLQVIRQLEQILLNVC